MVEDILINILFGYLDPDSALMLAKISHLFSRSCKQPLEMYQFIKYLVCGEEDKAITMFQSNPSLLLQKSNVNDFSDRQFYQITAFQYTLWALDRDMWELILPFLPKEEAIKQLDELESTGIEYVQSLSSDSKEIQIKKEKHYDFTQLISALENYKDNFDSKFEITERIRELAWCNNVGGAQKKVPVHVAAEFCRRDYNLDEWDYKFDSKALPIPRPLTVCKRGLILNSGFFWFDPRLGTKWGIVRGDNMTEKTVEAFRINSNLFFARYLFQTRIKNLNKLKDTLLTSTSKDSLRH